MFLGDGDKIRSVTGVTILFAECEIRHEAGRRAKEILQVNSDSFDALTGQSTTIFTRHQSGCGKS
jgi:hypothetical protein